MDLSKKIEYGPLYEAYEKKNKECKLCTLVKLREEKYVKSVLDGELLIKPDFRNELIRGSFCTRHLEKLSAIRDKLGLALLLESCLQKQVQGVSGGPKPGLKVWFYNALRHPQTDQGQTKNACSICSYLLTVDKENADKLLTLLIHDSAFRHLFNENYTLLCHRHYTDILSFRNHKKRTFGHAVRGVIKLQTEALEKVQRDLSWFIQKFNYSNREMPWYDAKDSLQRVIDYLK